MCCPYNLGQFRRGLFFVWLRSGGRDVPEVFVSPEIGVYGKMRMIPQEKMYLKVIDIFLDRLRKHT